MTRRREQQERNLATLAARYQAAERELGELGPAALPAPPLEPVTAAEWNDSGDPGDCEAEIIRRLGLRITIVPGTRRRSFLAAAVRHRAGPYYQEGAHRPWGANLEPPLVDASKRRLAVELQAKLASAAGSVRRRPEAAVHPGEQFAGQVPGPVRHQRRSPGAPLRYLPAAGAPRVAACLPPALITAVHPRPAPAGRDGERGAAHRALAGQRAGHRATVASSLSTAASCGDSPGVVSVTPRHRAAASLRVIPEATNWGEKHGAHQAAAGSA